MHSTTLNKNEPTLATSSHSHTQSLARYILWWSFSSALLSMSMAGFSGKVWQNSSKRQRSYLSPREKVLHIMQLEAAKTSPISEQGQHYKMASRSANNQRRYKGVGDFVGMAGCCILGISVDNPFHLNSTNFSFDVLSFHGTSSCRP